MIFLEGCDMSQNKICPAYLPVSLYSPSYSPAGLNDPDFMARLFEELPRHQARDPCAHYQHLLLGHPRGGCVRQTVPQVLKQLPAPIITVMASSEDIRDN